jgi:transglutaminase-like putative cysteine protease
MKQAPGVLLAVAALMALGSGAPPPHADPAGPATAAPAPAAAPAAAATRTFRFTYTVAVRNIPRGAHRLSIWVPVPDEDAHQDVTHLTVKSPLQWSFTRERRYGNRLLHLGAEAPLPDSVDLELEAVIERRAYRVLGNPAKPDSADVPGARDLGPDALVPIDGEIADVARKATAGAHTPLEKARAIYEHVTSTMRYDKTGVGWGRGDAIRACDVRAGNCTDFHSLIIGMARSQKIPARFVIGFPLPEDQKQGVIAGYHCWAEMYVEGIGWLPVDSSEASKHPEKRATFFGGLDANRVEFTRGRDLELEPPASEKLNFLVYPRVELDGAVYPRVTQRFSFAEIGT